MENIKVALVDMLQGRNPNPQLPIHLQEGFGAVVGLANTLAGIHVGEQEITEFRPDLLLLFGSIYSDDVDYSRITRAARLVGSHVAVWLHDDPYEFDLGFRAVEIADTIFTNDRWAVEHYDHPRVFHLPLAASPTFHHRQIGSLAQRQYDLFFCGVAFSNRIQMIRDLGPKLRGYSTLICGSGWPLEAYPARNLPIRPEELPDYYANSKLVLNVGRDLDISNERYRLPATTPGPRTFEAAMAGGPQLYFVSSLEIGDYFEPGKEILLFDHSDEVVAALEAVKKDPGVFLPIANAAQERAMRDHTYARRAETLLQACSLAPMGAQIT